jgi:hypothetical protein
LAFASSVSAQIVYEPVEYQYEAGGTLYYYGGSDPAVHQNARLPYNEAGTWGRTEGFAFASGDTRVHREVVSEPERIYTDATRLSNARLLGYTIDDARNEAYANAARYFAKRDLPSMAVPKNGGWSVPASGMMQVIRVYKSNGQEITPRAPTMPQPLLIIPKDALQQKPRTTYKVARAD